MVRYYLRDGGTRYGPSSRWKRHNDRGDASSNTKSSSELKTLAKRYEINPKTVAKRKRRTSVADLSMGPKDAKFTILSVEGEAIIVAFRRHTLLPLDDCLYALQATIPHLIRSSLQRHGIGGLPEVTGDKPDKQKFKAYPIG